MKIFKRDLSALRRQALEETSKAASQLAQLRTDRQKVLLDADLATLEQHDAGIAAQERRIASLQEKLRALTDEQRRERQERREEDRQAAIKQIDPELKKRETLAIKVEQSIETLSTAYFALLECVPVSTLWPFPPPKAGFGRVDFEGVRREVGWALFGAGRATAGRSHLPVPNNLGLGVAGVRPEGVANLIRRQNKEMIELLHVASLGRDAEPEENAA